MRVIVVMIMIIVMVMMRARYACDQEQHRSNC
jgi:hypothetical protein